MKLVSAIVRPFKLDEVRAALALHGVCNYTVSEVRGYGPQKAAAEFYRGATYAQDFLPKVKIEIIAEDAQLPLVLESVQHAAFTGKSGDGAIIVTDILDALALSA